jgi:sugar phosphate isomerase/epimerase
MNHPGEQYYPQGVRWDDAIARGTLPDLLSTAAAEYGERPAIEFRDRLVHVHAKDDKTVADRLYDRGVMGLGWHIPKLPGFGDVQWNQFFSALTDIEYRGPVCVEVEDRAYEGSLADRKRALRQSKRFLEQFVS